jgi:two-component system, cell cycle response regulator
MMRGLRYGFTALLGAALVVHMLHTFAGVGGAGSEKLFSGWVYLGVIAGAAVLCLWRVVTVPEERLAWLCVSGYLVMVFAGELLWIVWLLHVEEPPFPSVADGLYLVGYASAYAGLVLLLRSRVRSFTPSLWLDGLVAGLTLAAVCAALVFGPVLSATSGDAVTIAFTLAYPVCDLLLLCLVGVAFGLTGWRPGRAFALLGIGFIVVASADAAWAYMEASGSFEAGTVVTSTWMLSTLAIALAAWQPIHRAAVRTNGMEIIAVPGIFALVSLGILLWAPLGHVPYPAVALAGAALAAGALRGGLTFRENVALLRRSREQAFTDALSGLGNRRNLLHHLDDAMAAAKADRPQTLVFFDLDGFKGYNDSFGHNAGDALLARLGQQLAEAVTGLGEAFRLGGDEFCVLLHHAADRDDPAVMGAAVALTARGEGFTIGASYGLVSLPGDADNATLALQLADERMYANKDSRRGSVRRQALDVLMQVLREREPTLCRHMDDVAAHAVAVGRRMGLDAEAIDELGRAAELHDVGKIAVPDAILHKPGPLDELEWELIRQHTIIGERILAAAPALRPVGRLVRASHERLDGAGYPDGLAGEDIPLGARIIAVCDAFDAMTSDRTYRTPFDTDAAVAELRRCAGTQFDRDVVAAFLATLQSPDAKPPDPDEVTQPTTLPGTDSSPFSPTRPAHLTELAMVAAKRGHRPGPRG